MEKLTLTIPGPPIAKKRPRFVRRGKFVSTYNPQETEEGRWLWEAMRCIPPDFGVITDPVEIRATFFMPIPKSLSAKKRLELKHHVKKQDIDNMLKFALDCLNGMLIKDDKQVYKITAEKLYSENPRTCVEVVWKEGE